MMARDEDDARRLKVIGGMLPAPTTGAEMYLAAIYEAQCEMLVLIESLTNELALMRASQPPAGRASIDEIAGARDATASVCDGPDVLARPGARRRKDSSR